MAFVNRKQFYSINLQAVCDSDAFITNIVARWPRSTHDSRIFKNSNIADKLRDGALDGILLGDSGYACRAYLLTPILKPKNAGEVRYNTAHRRTRCVIERCFGMLKRCFPCLHLGLHTALVNTLVIIVVTSVLHNFALVHREQDFDEDIEDEDVPFDIVAAADASGRMPSASSLFHDTLLNKINDLMKLHVRLIENKIRKHMKTFTAIILIRPLILLF